MKKYSIFELFVVEKPLNSGLSKYFLCKYDGIFGVYVDFKSGTRLTKSSNVQTLSNYYEDLSLSKYIIDRTFIGEDKIDAIYNELNSKSQVQEKVYTLTLKQR